MTSAKLVVGLAKGAEEFRRRRLPECVVVYMDGTYVPLKRSYGGSSSVSKEYIEVAIGVTRDARPSRFMPELSEEEKAMMGFDC